MWAQKTVLVRACVISPFVFDPTHAYFVVLVLVLTTLHERIVDQMEEAEITVGPEVASSASIAPKNKPIPKNGKIPVRFVYHPSPDGVDENLLIMLHGLGSL